MRLLIASVFIIVLSTSFSSCKKSKEISFPTTGSFGENILLKNNGDSLSNISSYSLTADLGRKAELKIIITNQSLSNETWFYTSVDGWEVSDYSGKQTFTSSNNGIIDLDIEFVAGTGTYLEGRCQVDIYENSENITKSILLNW